MTYSIFKVCLNKQLVYRPIKSKKLIGKIIFLT